MMLLITLFIYFSVIIMQYFGKEAGSFWEAFESVNTKNGPSIIAALHWAGHTCSSVVLIYTWKWQMLLKVSFLTLLQEGKALILDRAFLWGVCMLLVAICTCCFSQGFFIPKRCTLAWVEMASRCELRHECSGMDCPNCVHACDSHSRVTFYLYLLITLSCFTGRDEVFFTKTVISAVGQLVNSNIILCNY